MISTQYGQFDGPSWERMCQHVFARKYSGYQRLPASPGDYGIEGYTKPEGWAFQCYCPEKHYTQPELYEHLRDKLTKDVGKLRKNAHHLIKFLGSTTLTRWIFVTPEIGNHSLLAHAQVKEAELRSWGLGFVDPAITVEVQGGEFYAQEIHQIRTQAGERPALDGVPIVLPPLNAPQSVYEANILRKSRLRLSGKRDALQDSHIDSLYSMTLTSFVQCDEHFRRIEEQAPTVHQRLVRLVNEFEAFVVETCMFFKGEPEEMTMALRQNLEQRLLHDLSDAFDGAEILAITRRIVARWLAICSLDYE